MTVEPSTRYKVIDDIVYEKDGQTKNVEPWCAIQSIECRLKRLRLRIVGFRMRSMEISNSEDGDYSTDYYGNKRVAAECGKSLENCM